MSDLQRRFITGAELIERWHTSTTEFVALIIKGGLQPCDATGDVLHSSDQRSGALKKLRDAIEATIQGSADACRPGEAETTSGLPDLHVLPFQQLCHTIDTVIDQFNFPCRSRFREHIEGLIDCCRYRTAEVTELERKFPSLVRARPAAEESGQVSIKTLAEEVGREADSLYKGIMENLHYNGQNITTASQFEIHRSLTEVLPELHLSHLEGIEISQDLCALKSKDPRRNFVEKLIQIVFRNKGQQITLEQAADFYPRK